MHCDPWVIPLTKSRILGLPQVIYLGTISGPDKLDLQIRVLGRQPAAWVGVYMP